MKMIKEFREFAVKGNVLDLAVAVIIGGAFGKIVTSFVDDILMPPIGYLLGGFDFSQLSLKLSEEVTWNYGNFIQVTVNFFIIAFSMFLVVKSINKMKRKDEKQEEAPAEPSEEVKLLTEIRDYLKR